MSGVINARQFLIEDERDTRLADWLACYWYLALENPLWLKGLVPDPAYTAGRIRQQVNRARLEKQISQVIEAAESAKYVTGDAFEAERHEAEHQPGDLLPCP